MKLSRIFANVRPLEIFGDPSIEITGISQDSRSVKPGDLFVCIKGTKYDGHQFLSKAAAAGAVAAVVEDLPEDNYGLTLVKLPSVATDLKEFVSSFYNYPDRQLHLIGVIGTNGKTTSTYLMKNILEAAGFSTGLIGTIANLIKERLLEAHNTTPGTLELQQLFAEMVAAGVSHVVMEVSSHSIHQGRIGGLNFKNGIFTNITQDHLDYHKTFEEYLDVKTSFFADLADDAHAAINIDDLHAEYIISRTKAKITTYGIKGPADVRAENIRVTANGVIYTVFTPQGSIDLDLKLTGSFNIYNSLGVVASALAMGIDLKTIKQGLENVIGVPGRFQLVTVPNANFGVIVDYAHTPDGLENILTTGRGLKPNRLWVVFGCGGDRDRTKRPQMGALAAKLADYTIITSDNPRSEDPLSIIKDIEAGFVAANPNARYSLIPDREQAIREAIRRADAGDLILIAGKGHETYQIFKDETIHFDDREVAHQALAERFQ
jgi:UDP-N-acetylmuramoyl-L-alanyl-D-glutamate--2,6-diaminopimelate ligase